VRFRILSAGVAAAVLLMSAPAQAYEERAMQLPVRAGALAASASQPATWLVGAKRGPASARIARRFAARGLKLGTAYRVATPRARAFADALRRAGRLTYAEPNIGLQRASALDALPDAGPRAAVVDPGLVAPAPVPTASIAVVDDLVDVSLADLQPNTRQLNPGPILGPHGTQVASVAAGVLDGSGVFGIFPGAPVLSVGLPQRITCADAANAILAAASARARVINLSFGSPVPCATLFNAVQGAYASGSLVVAASGNEFASGNPVIYPAAYPHVLSVAALDGSLRPSAFSSTNAAVDIAAPGVGVPVAVPLAFDGDGVVDGVTLVDGTSFSSPIVAGAAALVATARPSLNNGQLADVLRRSARDVGAAGYDASTGFGLVRVPEALSHPTPVRDVLEPNDGISFVDGSAFGSADPFVWKGTGRRTLRGSVDRVEDPVDVLRIRMPRGALLRIRLRPTAGNPDLRVFSASADSTDDTGRIIARSSRSARATDSVRFVNRSSRNRTAYVVVDVSTVTGTALNATYRLEFQRLKRR
jgi:hypothetical protein